MGIDSKVTIIVAFSAILVLFFGMTLFDDVQALKSAGNSLTEVSSKQVCGNFLCDEPLSIAEKIAAYLLNLAQAEEPETNILQQAFFPRSFGGERMIPFPDIAHTPTSPSQVPIPYPNIGESKAPKTFKGLDVKMTAPQIGAKSIKSFDVKQITPRDIKASELAGRLIKQYDLKQERLSPIVSKIAEKFQPTLDREKITQMRIAQKELERIQIGKLKLDIPIIKKGDSEIICIQAPCVPPDRSTKDITKTKSAGEGTCGVQVSLNKGSYSQGAIAIITVIDDCMDKDSSKIDRVEIKANGREGFRIFNLWETGVNTGVFTANEITWYYLWPESGTTLTIQYPAEGTPIVTATANIDLYGSNVNNQAVVPNITLKINQDFYYLSDSIRVTITDLYPALEILEPGELGHFNAPFAPFFIASGNEVIEQVAFFIDGGGKTFLKGEKIPHEFEASIPISEIASSITLGGQISVIYETATVTASILPEYYTPPSDMLTLDTRGHNINRVPIDQAVVVKLKDGFSNKDPSAIDVVQVGVQDRKVAGVGGTTQFDVYETAPNSGIFTGTIPDLTELGWEEGRIMVSFPATTDGPRHFILKYFTVYTPNKIEFDKTSYLLKDRMTVTLTCLNAGDSVEMQFMFNADASSIQIFRYVDAQEIGINEGVFSYTWSSASELTNGNTGTIDVKTGINTCTVSNTSFYGVSATATVVRDKTGFGFLK